MSDMLKSFWDAVCAFRRYLVADMTPTADRRELAKAGGSLKVTTEDALWLSCLRRAAVMPNRAEWDADAAWLLIAGTGSGVVRIVEGVES